MTEAATQTNGATAGATHAPVIETSGTVDKSAPPKTPTLHERMIAAAKATKEAVDAGKVTEDAVKEGAEAGAAVEAEPAAEDAKEPKEAKDEKAKAEPAADENPIARIQREMRAREKARTIELEAQMHREEVEREREAFKQQQAAFDRDRQQLASMLEQFKTDPLKFVETQGYDRDKLAEHFVNAGKPEHQLAQKLEAQERQIQQLVEFIKNDREQRAQQETVAQQQAREQAERASERKFIAEFASPEKAPSLHAVAKISRQGEKYIVERANEVAAWFKAETGKYPSWETLAEYLEQQAAADLKENGGGAQAKAPKPAGKSTATTRTLSQGMSDERRSAVKPLQDMTKAERLAAMEQAARDARRSAG